jgi:hypothetical protein
MLMAGVTASGAFAQAQQPRKHFGDPGTLELGGSMTFTASQPVLAGTAGSWVYDFSLLPYAGYFVIEGLELGVNPAGVNVQSSGDTTAVQLRILFAPAYNFRTGTMVTPFVEGLELGINPAGVNVQSSGDTTAVQLRILFAPAYNFRTGTMVTPFVEGLAGVTSASLIRPGLTTSISGFTFGGRAGIKTALSERGMLTIGIQFLRITLNPSGAASRNGSNELSVSAGWTIWL